MECSYTMTINYMKATFQLAVWTKKHKQTKVIIIYISTEKACGNGLETSLMEQCYFLLCRALASQSIAWSRPSPFVADVLNIWKVLFFSASKPSAWWTSATVIQPAISCLFANTTRIASDNSSSWKCDGYRDSFW